MKSQRTSNNGTGQYPPTENGATRYNQSENGVYYPQTQPRSQSRERSVDPYLETDGRPVHDKAGDVADGLIGFIFHPAIIKCGVVAFILLCAILNISGYYDLVAKALHSNIDAVGRSLPVTAPLDQRLISFFLYIPVIGDFVRFLNTATGGLVALIASIVIWFFVQGAQIAGRANWYFLGLSENLLHYENGRQQITPRNTVGARRAYKMVARDSAIAFLLAILVGIGFYIFDWNMMGQARPWTNRAGDPIFLNASINVLAVFGVELGLLIYKVYRLFTTKPQTR